MYICATASMMEVPNLDTQVSKSGIALENKKG